MPPLPETIAGHERQRGQLLSDIAEHNVTHAYLFAGPPHIGKTTIAHWFASLLLSEHVTPEERGAVRTQVERLIHPDFLCLDALWMEGTQDDWATIARSSNAPQQHRSKAPAAKTDIISIEDVRAIGDRLSSTGSSPYVCCVIRGIERMQPAAANAFLKILEEPPSRVVFLLTTDHLSELLPTVISRTRVLRFSRLTAPEMKAFGATYDPEDTAFALHIAEGAPGMLQRLLDDTELLRKHRQLHAQAKQFWQARTRKDRLAWIIKAIGEKQDIDIILLHLGLTLREYPDPLVRSSAATAYAELMHGLKTNAHKALLFERFTLAVQGSGC